MCTQVTEDMFVSGLVDPVRQGGAALRAFINVVALWQLSDEDQLSVLGIRSRLELQHLKADAQANIPVAIPMEVIVRIGCVISIYASLRKLLVSDSGIAKWPHTLIDGPVFCGRSPLAVMTSGKLSDVDAVAKYLLGIIHGQ